MNVSIPMMTIPNWDPGTSELRCQGKLCGLSFVETQQVRLLAGGYHSYDAVEHLVFVLAPGDTAKHIAYPKVIPYHTTTSTTTTSRQPASTVTVSPAMGEVDFVQRVRTELSGCQIVYVVGGVDYFVGLPRMKVGEQGPPLVHVDSLMSDYQSEVVYGWAGAESPVSEVFLVHQAMPFRMHLGRPAESTQCPSAKPPGVRLKQLFDELSAGEKVWMYSRGHARHFLSGPVEAFNYLASAPGRVRPIEADCIRGVIGIESPLEP